MNMKNFVFYYAYLFIGFIFLLAMASLLTKEVEPKFWVIIIDTAMGIFLLLGWKKFQKIADMVKKLES